MMLVQQRRCAAASSPGRRSQHRAVAQTPKRPGVPPWSRHGAWPAPVHPCGRAGRQRESLSLARRGLGRPTRSSAGHAGIPQTTSARRADRDPRCRRHSFGHVAETPAGQQRAQRADSALPLTARHCPARCGPMPALSPLSWNMRRSADGPNLDTPGRSGNRPSKDAAANQPAAARPPAGRRAERQGSQRWIASVGTWVPALTQVVRCTCRFRTDPSGGL